MQQHFPIPEGRGPVEDFIGKIALYRRGVRYRTFLGRVPIVAAALSYTGPPPSGIGLYRQIALYRRGVRYRANWVPFYLVGFRIPMPDPGGPV